MDVCWKQKIPLAGLFEATRWCKQTLFLRQAQSQQMALMAEMESNPPKSCSVRLPWEPENALENSVQHWQQWECELGTLKGGAYE